MATGPGYFDSEGVWQYGEDDLEVLMSELLNKGQQSVSAALALDRARMDEFTDWTAYPSGHTGFVVGTGGSALTEYRRERDLIRVRYKFVFGTAAQTFPNTPKIALPAAAAALPHSYTFLNGGGDVFDTSSTRPIQSWIITDAASTSLVRIAMRVTTGDGYDYPTPSTPFLWAAGDMMQGEFTYRPAA